MSYVLIIGLDEPLQHPIERLFRNEGYEVVVVEDGSEGRARIMNRDPSLVVMPEDLSRFGDDEQGALNVLRRFTSAPIVVIGIGGEIAVVKALLDGADVYLRRPINQRELLSRARVLMRRASNE